MTGTTSATAIMEEHQWKRASSHSSLPVNLLEAIASPLMILDLKESIARKIMGTWCIIVWMLLRCCSRSIPNFKHKVGVVGWHSNCQMTSTLPQRNLQNSRTGMDNYTLLFAGVPESHNIEQKIRKQVNNFGDIPQHFLSQNRLVKEIHSGFRGPVLWEYQNQVQEYYRCERASHEVSRLWLFLWIGVHHVALLYHFQLWSDVVSQLTNIKGMTCILQNSVFIKKDMNYEQRMDSLEIEDI